MYKSFLVIYNPHSSETKYNCVDIIGFKKKPDVRFKHKIKFVSDLANVLEDSVMVESNGRMKNDNKCNITYQTNITLSKIISTFAFLENSVGIYNNDGDEDYDRNDYFVENGFPILISFEKKKMSLENFKNKYIKLTAEENLCKWRNKTF